MLPELYAERQFAAIEAVCVPTMTPATRQAVISRLARMTKRPNVRARSLHEALGGFARRIDVPRKAKK